MAKAQFQSTDERIERLERRLRRQTRFMIAGAVLFVATSILMAQAPSKRILEAEQFILRGPQGQELARLDRADTGATLILYDNHHRGRMILLSSDSESGAVFIGTDQKSGASIEVNDRNRPVVALMDENGRTRGDFGLTDQGPVLRMRDSTSTIRAVVAIHDEAPVLSVNAGPDPKKGSVVISAGAKGGGVLITGPDGKSRNVVIR